MDIATIVGFILGTGLLMFGIVDAGGGGEFLSPASFAITIGGAVAATLISLPLDKVKGSVGVVRNAFLTKTQEPKEMIKQLVSFAEVARRDGILALEESSKDVKDEFMVKGLQLAVDGADPELINTIMSTELENLSERHKVGRSVFEQLGKYAPAFGMVGTLVGLVALLKNLDDPSAVGPAMAVALITTLYGAVAANFVFLPLADKLAIRSKQEMLLKEIIIQGVMAIQSGDNPRIVEQKLAIFLEPKLRVLRDAA